MKSLFRTVVFAFCVVAIIAQFTDADNTYIVTSSSRRISVDLRNNLGLSDDNFIKVFNDVGIAIVYSTDPDFETKASQVKGVKSVVKDISSDHSNLGEYQGGLFRQNDLTNTPGIMSDPFVSLQWGLNAINALEAHQAGFRGQGVRIAVLDGGFDLNHPDLIDNIDFLASQSFVPTEPLQFVPPASGNTFSHGTHVAGIIGAADNGIGILGVAPEAELILVKVLTNSGTTRTSWVVDGFMHAVNSGAKVINLSFGQRVAKDSPNAVSLLETWTTLTNYANSNGVTIIASTGNDNINRDQNTSFIDLPADAPHVLTISATSPLGWVLDPNKRSLDNIASYSDFGIPEIDFAAPGGNSNYPDSTIVTFGGLTSPVYVFDLLISTNFDNSWAFGAGTSYAAPHVSGVAALIIGKYNGKISPGRVAAILRKSAADLGQPGRDPYFGFGRVNALKAIQCSIPK